MLSSCSAEPLTLTLPCWIAGTSAAQALAQAIVQTANQTNIPAATQALSAVGDAGVQSVEVGACCLPLTTTVEHVSVCAAFM